MENQILDNYAAYNRWQVMEGMRTNESGVKPSVYITEIKFKKLFKTLDKHELKRIFSLKKDLDKLAIERHQKKLSDKIEKISEDQILTALNIYIRHEDVEIAATYIWSCHLPTHKRKD